MKAVVERSPLSASEIKGYSGECRLHSHEEAIVSFAHWSEKLQRKLRSKNVILCCQFHEWGERPSVVIWLMNSNMAHAAWEVSQSQESQTPHIIHRFTFLRAAHSLSAVNVTCCEFGASYITCFHLFLLCSHTMHHIGFLPRSIFGYRIYHLTAKLWHRGVMSAHDPGTQHRVQPNIVQGALETVLLWTQHSWSYGNIRRCDKQSR